MRAVLVSMLALAAFAPALARADGGVRLDWVRGDGAEACTDGRALEELVRAELGRDPFGAPFEYSVEGAVTVELDRVVARLRLRSAARGPLGDRRIDAADCDALTPALVLALALAIDELTPAESVAPEEVGETRAAPVEVRAAAAAVGAVAEAAFAAPEESEEADALEGSVMLQLPVSIGTLPRPAIGVGLGGGAQYGLWALEGSVRYFPEVGLTRRATEYAFSWIAFSVASGFVLRIDRFEVAALAGLEIGGLSAHALQHASPDAGTEPTIAPLLAARARYFVADFLALELAFAGTVALERHGYFVRGSEALLFEQAPVGFSASIGVAAHFGRAR